ncbi:pilus assembly protein FimV [Lysobacter ruishenii]|uniref:Pilus assembly protein FimV n=1 Tax=Aerolutibacter ruishenii TaxID=686800 RepID=A0A562LYG9_9GAMM|nr:pilus assembly protein FimV [Lysobacter ruishenii]
MHVKPLAQKSLRVALALSLAMASGAAAALGLGQIELKSRLGQPLLAEIPIISSDPAELEQLRAGLPSPETFARIGLQLPDEFVSSLRFTQGVDSAGRPVIRVTSEAPVNDPLLTFLVEVDWGQGRLVREYSALVDAPRTVSAPVQPAIEEATVAPANTIEREPALAEATTPAEPPRQVDAAGRRETEDTAIAVAPKPATSPAVAVARNTSAPAAIARMGGEYGPVKAGDSLSRIAGGFGTPGRSLEQTMITLLRANPEAFIGGNINRLKRGAVLRMPQGDELAVGANEAVALVQAQAKAWRAETRRPVREPAAEVAAVAAPRVAAVPQSAGRRTADARLEIVPPGASNAKRAGTQSGIQAGGEGEMLRQELQQTRESLAARDAEVAEMKSRIEDLEKLQAQQQQLISMKDSELAAAQKRLADSNKAEARPQATNEAGMGPTPWLLGGAVLLLAGLAGWWFNRRRGNATASSFRETVAAPRGPSLADSFGPPSASSPETATASVEPSAPVRSEPAWHIPSAAKSVPGAAQDVPAASLAPPAPGAERLELAQVFIDLGDQESARKLLAEVLADSDTAVRERAERMLRELG